MTRRLAPAALVALLAVGGAACRSDTGDRAGPAPRSSTTRAADVTSAPTTTAPAAVSTAVAPFRLPAPRSGAAGATLGGALFVIGGQDANKASTNTVWRVDARTGSVTPDGTLALALHDAGAAVLGNTITLFGGGANVQFDTVQRIVPGGVATRVGRLPSGRSDVSVAATATDAYVVGGYDGTADVGEVLRTSDGVTFATVATLDVPVRYAAVAVRGSTLWVVGGLRGDGDQRSVQRVDLASGAVTRGPELPFTLAHAVAFGAGDRWFVAGGRRDGAASATVYELDPVAGTLRAVAELPYGALDAAVATVGDTTYLLGGRREQNLADVATVTVR